MTPTIVAGAQGDFLAVIDVPVKGAQIPGAATGTFYTADAAATTGAAGSNPEPVVSQSATGVYSTDKATDLNDLIKVAYVGGITVAKTQNANNVGFGTGAQTAKPGDTLNYQIVAKNTYNSSVANFKLIDNGSTASTAPVVAANNAYTYTNFVSASVALSSEFDALTSKTVYYSVDGGSSWSATAPTTATVTAAKGIWVAVDTDNSKSITSADIVPAGATITLTINTTVK